MPKSITLDKNKIIAQLAGLPKIAKKENWQLDYDAKLDELTFGKAVMPKDSFLVNIGKEINLFLTPSSHVRGIFIEYFATNYLEHNVDFKPILDILEEATTNVEDELDKKALENELALESVNSLLEKDTLVTAV
ncbi:hypothetical protein HY379_01055 [Candidatus Saccharibacteria bacterium]|nr:hypothetical protein [Candidatus Saccharibacteria bacterium]